MKRVPYIAAIVVAVLLTSCATRPSEREMNYLASALTKVSAAVDGTVRYRRPAENLAGDDLLRLATAHDPALMKPFDGMTVRVLRMGRDSAVLVCDQSASRALLEDAGCTAKTDLHRWNSGTDDRCEFKLDVEKTCAR